MHKKAVMRQLPQKALFSIIIVTFQSEEWIGDCLHALISQTYSNFELIIIDNASTDSTLEQIDNVSQLDPVVVRNDENHGFAAACNQGAKLANAPWIVFLNPDTVASETWLSEVKAGIARHPQVRMFASTQFKLRAQNMIDGAGDVYSIFGAAWRGGEGQSISSLPQEGECFSPCGAAAIFSRRTFEAHHGFDERLFCYFEDVDLGFRMRLANETCIYLEKAHVFHKGGGSAKENDESFSIYHGFRNRYWVCLKNVHLKLLVFSLPALVLLTIIQAFSARKAKRGYSRVILSALFDAIKGGGPYWRARASLDHTTYWTNARRMMCTSITKLRHRSAHVLDSHQPN